MKHLASLLLLTPVAVALAAPEAPLSTAPVQQDLKEIRQQINTLKKDLRTKESDRAEASDALKASAAAVAEASRLLQELEQQQGQTQQALRQLQQEILKVTQQVNKNRQRVSRILKAQYVNRHSADPLALFLQQDNPNRFARDLSYYGYLARAQQQEFDQLHERLTELDALSSRLESEQTKLARLEEERQKRKASLVNQQQSHATLVARLSKEIDSQQTRIANLQEDEKRLTQLISRIQRQIAERRREEARKRAEARKQAQIAARREAERRAAEARKAGKPVPKAEPVKEAPVVDDVADDSAAGRAFGSLRGRMKLPASGTISGQFGARRSEGTSWRGVFIKAPEGQPVRAVADGRVVYADTLRGFGNMLIIDHGGGYMTIYGNGNQLAKSVGATVRAGDVVASTGNSGNMEDSGIYFELRHLGQPLNPSKWAR
ncbi:murein hydrolase activator EnvC family protein [Laribacter hongkongensis]|uniref:Peptidase family M23 protein n=3 Tax=Laribacter hongkongensis TaxID=168471 RepID=A0A248LLS5_9NEIS|nr:peptidoglycan DD-metalloendopeptidase family protein [Laribacter hongkongensis]ASJ25612.1 peptidase family M23 protein [Laribacter hongkongensis]MCG9090021.1 peptidoglycan DD-metalloendopeptidase family protein [Laribacter hongkongensis]MCG9110324.1 peptidoglycan DD-metalloendopeptidase family protein [Laribacter hongkongensis]